MDCRDCQHRKSGKSLFSCVSEESICALDENKVGRSYPRGHTLFLEAEEPTGVYCLQKGLVKLETYSDDGQSQLLRVARPGDPLGYRALLGNRAFRYRATAVTPIQACFLQGKLLKDMAREDTEFAQALIQKLSQDLDFAESRWLGLLQKSSEQRVAEILLEIEEADENWPPRKEMAQMIDITPETFARVLSAFHKKGWVRRDRKTINLLDREALRELAG